MPYISTEVLLTVGLIAILALGSQLLPKAARDEGKGKAKKKNKKKNKGSDAVSVSEGIVESVKDVKSAAGGVVEKNGKSKAKGKKTQTKAAAPTPVASSQAAPPVESSSESDPDFPSIGFGASAKKTKDMTLAERIKAKPKATLIDDMLAPEDRPKDPKRVVAVGAAATRSSQKVEASANVYEPEEESDVEGRATASGSGSASISLSGSGSRTVDDDGWDVVPAKSKKPQAFSVSNTPKIQSSTSQPLPVATKLQKKNQAQSAAKKAQKEAEEADRLRRLADHRRGLERERINEIYKQKEKDKAKGGKVLSGGQKATIDSNGKLVWD